MTDIDFTKDLPTYFRKYFPKLSVNSTAIGFFSQLLNVANSRLLGEMVSAKKKSILHASQFAADKVLPKCMLRLAKSEATRQLALYEIGVLDYNGSSNAGSDGRRISKTKARKMMVQKSMGKEGKATKKVGHRKGFTVRRAPKALSPFNAFSVGISKLQGLTNSHLFMQKDGSQYLSSCLFYFMKTFASKLALQEPNNPVGPMEIKYVLFQILGPNVFNSAISEGNKCLMLYENDLIKFDPKDMHQKHDNKTFTHHIDTQSFRPGIHFLLRHRFARPFAAVDNSSEYVEHVLLEVAGLFAAEVGGNCVRGKVEFMDENDVKNMMDDILPEELRRHAIARASIALADYVAETSELYHSSISNTLEGFPQSGKRKYSAKPPVKRPKLEMNPKAKSSKTIVANKAPVKGPKLEMNPKAKSSKTIVANKAPVKRPKLEMNPKAKSSKTIVANKPPVKRPKLEMNPKAKSSKTIVAKASSRNAQKLKGN